jgi:YD repeat-containing protein
MSVAGQTTTYEYWPTGLLKKVTQPDGGWVAYGYDDAHRLTDVSDNLGNSVHYTLDNSGNRTKEETKDPSGALALQLSRVMDALSRVQQTTGRE